MKTTKFRGVLSDPSVPHGSPLDPTRDTTAPIQGVLSSASNISSIGSSPPAPLSVQDAGAPVGVLSSTNALTPTAPKMQPAGYKPFSKENRSATLLAIGTGLLSHPESFAAGIGAAGQNVGGLRKQYQSDQRNSSTVGGPDDAFEITTDPQTGEKTFKEIPAFTGYLTRKNAAKKAPSAKDNVNVMGALAQAVMQQPPEKQQAAYEAQRGVLSKLGFDLSGLPDTYGPSMGALVRDTAIPAAAALANQARAARAAQAQANFDQSYALKLRAAELADKRFKRGPVSSKPDANADLNY